MDTALHLTLFLRKNSKLIQKNIYKPSRNSWLVVRLGTSIAFVLHSGGFEHKPILLAAPGAQGRTLCLCLSLLFIL